MPGSERIPTPPCPTSPAKVVEKEYSIEAILKELAEIQNQGPKNYCVLGTRHCSFLHQQVRGCFCGGCHLVWGFRISSVQFPNFRTSTFSIFRIFELFIFSSFRIFELFEIQNFRKMCLALFFFASGLPRGGICRLFSLICNAQNK